MASLNLAFPEDNSLVSAPLRTTNDLPPQIVGNVAWHQGHSRRNPFMYWVSINNRDTPVKFINNHWFALTAYQGAYHTQRSLIIPTDNDLGLHGYPEQTPLQPVTRTGFGYNPDESSSESSGESTATQQSFTDTQETPALQINTSVLHAPPDNSAPEQLFAPPQEDPHENPDRASMTTNPPVNGREALRRTAPAIFNGD